MPGTATQPCEFAERVAAAAREKPGGEAAREVHRHLEHCESCRAEHRRIAAGRFPRLRSYTFVDEIGAGCFGKVYRVVHHAKERTEALKVLNDYTQFRQAASFENEIHLIAQLRHPNIATLYDAHLGTPPFYYTMEFVDGRPLDQHFRSPDVQLVERIRILRKVAEAMDYAHGQGVVHRDLKPQNILVDAAGEPHIVDFGIARILSSPARSEAGDDGAAPGPESRRYAIAEGSEGYTAPEVRAGQRGDGRADVFAIGALLCRGLTGREAPPGNRVAALSDGLAELEVRRPGELAAMIDKCLREEPAERYATCGQLAADLVSYLAARPLLATRPHTAGHKAARAAERFLRSRPRLVVGALAIAIAGTITALFAAGGAGSSQSAFAPGATVLIEFRPSTIDAVRSGRFREELPALSADARKSWRLLHGRVLGRLAEASPLAVVCDYFVPDCRPEFDEALVAGLGALKSASIPAVMGGKLFDVNGRPMGCRHVLEATHAVGALHGSNPAHQPGEFLAPICIIRGLAPPIPSLAIAGFAAARFPDALPVLRPQEDAVLLTYRRTDPAPGDKEWHDDQDPIAISHREQGNPTQLLTAEDTVLYARIPAASVRDWPQRAIAAEDALTVPLDELRRRVAGRVVLYGPAVPGEDEHKLADGTPIFGCWVQAQALDAFLSRGYAVPFGVFELLARCGAWALVAVVVVLWLPGPNRFSEAGALVCGAIILAGLAGALAAWWIASAAVEMLIAVCTLLAVGGAVYLYRAARASLARIAFNHPPSFPAAGDAEPDAA